jgi:outer membrane protein OmpA-like peptidoglycan-associated protein/tetratricopeptide (TPR) repeat protein
MKQNSYPKPMNKSLLLILLLSPAFMWAQIVNRDNAKGAAKEYYDKADHHFAFGRLEIADSLLHLAVKEKDNFIDAWILMGQINLQYLKKFDAATAAYEKVKLLKPDYLSDVDFQLGQCYMHQGQYAKARTVLKAFLAQTRIVAQSRMLAEKMLLDCDFAEEAIKHPVEMKPRNLGPSVNTAEDESMPSLTADGRYLYFTRHFGTGMYQDEDIYVAINTSAGFTKANSVGNAINTENFIEGAQSISPSGKYLFFTSAERPDGVGRADIYMSRKTGDVWERPNNIGAPVNSPGWDAQPCISPDGRTLYFASVRGNGKGGSDIWVSTLTENGTWSEPQMLSTNINTQYDEMRPFIHPDGNTLYFSSNGHPGMGGYDIFVSRKNADGSWGKPENLGYPINTPGDEVGIFVSTDGSTAYYASEQKDSYGQMDIYSFEMPQSARPAYTSYIKGNVFDSDNRDPLSATIQVFDLSTGKQFSSFSSDRINGTFLSTLPAGKDYAVEVMKDGYLFYSHHISLKEVKDGKPFELNIPLTKIKVGEKVVLNNVFFETDKFELKPESKAELDVIVKLIEKNPSLKIEIGGHTDNTGTEEKNRALSENRAKSVYEYLLSKGIDTSRITYKGYSSSKPVAGNDTPEGKAKNRRTEFTVTAI